MERAGAAGDPKAETTTHEEDERPPRGRGRRAEVLARRPRQRPGAGSGVLTLRGTAGLEGRLAAVRLVVLDVDGTVLTRGARGQGPHAARALALLDEAGVAWTFATGRPRDALREGVGHLVGGALPRHHACNNGAVMVVDGKTAVHAMEGDDVTAALAWAAGNGMPANLSAVERDPAGAGHGRDLTFHVDGVAPLAETARVARAATLAQALAHHVTGVLIGCGRNPTPAELAGLSARLGPGVEVTTSNHGEFIVTGRNADKGTALAAIAAGMGIGLEETMAVGDGLNDRAMVELAGIGVAVANADPALKAVADRVTLAPDAEGVLEVASDLVRAKAEARARGKRAWT